MATTPVLRIWGDEQGASHFEEVEIQLTPGQYAPPAPPFDVSQPIESTDALFFSLPVGWYGDWHPSPRRQIYINVSGELEIGVSDGQTRRLRPGAIVMVDDVTGQGHTTRVIGSVPSTGVFVQLADGQRTRS